MGHVIPGAGRQRAHVREVALERSRNGGAEFVLQPLYCLFAATVAGSPISVA